LDLRGKAKFLHDNWRHIYDEGRLAPTNAHGRQSEEAEKPLGFPSKDLCGRRKYGLAHQKKSLVSRTSTLHQCKSIDAGINANQLMQASMQTLAQLQSRGPD
jgi:hypothetical protein